MRKYRVMIILGLLMFVVLEASGYSGWSRASMQSSPPAFVTVGGLPTATAGQPYQFKLEAIGGTPPYLFSNYAGLGQPALPAGLTLDIDGNLSGIPDTSGLYSTVAFEVTDSKGLSTRAVYSMDVLTPDGTQGVRRLMMSGSRVAEKGFVEPDYVGLGDNYFIQDNDGEWTAQTMGFTASGEPDFIFIDFIGPDISDQVSSWSLSFSTAQLGVPFAAGVYDNCQRAAFATAGHPGLDVNGDGRGCDTDAGTFTVNSVTFDPSGNLETLDATFTQYCEDDTTRPLTGHIIYGLPAPDPSPGGPSISSALYTPQKGKLLLEGKNIDKQCALVVDGLQWDVDMYGGRAEKVGTRFKGVGLTLTPGTHQLQIGNLAGQLSPQYALRAP